MLRKYRFEILAVVAVLVFCALFLFASSRMGKAEFTGSDTAGSREISGITGIPEEEYRPLIGQWVPPGPGIESALFALQAAIGGGIVGWVFWYWRGLKAREGS